MIYRAFASTLAAIGLFVLSTPANAQMNGGLYGEVSAGGLYIADNSGSISGIDVTVETDTGFMFAGALGYRFGNGFRVGGELGYGHISGGEARALGVNVDIDTDLKLWSFTGAGYYDIEINNQFAPYFGGGAGVVITDMGRSTLSAGGATVVVGGDTDSNLTAFGEAGFSVQISPNVQVVPAYRYQWIDSGYASFDDDIAHIIKVGLRFDF
jgi:opacity protein-like surface antigen